MIYIGTSGYNYKHWKERFYPKGLSQKKWLEFYSEHFNIVEINATFYGFFKKKTFENWKKQTPKDFKFVLKGSRFITHIKRLKDVEEPVDNFFRETKGLGKKFILCLWQFSPQFKLNDINVERLKEFIKILPKKYLYAFEFRDSSWFTDEIEQLLKKHKASYVISSTSREYNQEKLIGDFVYIRFHGAKRMFSSIYSEEEMKKWAKRIKKWNKKYDVFCFFNNDRNAYAIKNANQLKSFT